MKERTYRIIWELMDVNSTTPRGAAEQALRTIRDPQSLATLFTVYETDGEFESYTVDLSQPLLAKPEPTEEPTMSDQQAKAAALLTALDDLMTLDYFMDHCVEVEVDHIDQTEVEVIDMDLSVNFSRHGRHSVSVESVEVEVPQSAVKTELKITDPDVECDTCSIIPARTYREILQFLREASVKPDDSKYKEMCVALLTAVQRLGAELVRIEEVFGKVN